MLMSSLTLPVSCSFSLEVSLTGTWVHETGPAFCSVSLTLSSLAELSSSLNTLTTGH